MKKTRLIIAILVGIIVGSALNMGLVILNSVLVPLEGIDFSDMEQLKEAMKLFEPEHFILPWMAHALGTLVGAFTATKIVRGKTHWPALLIGALFFVGGIMVAKDLPAPTWFNTVDLVFAYFPMAYLGYRWGK